jgi:hypothetical protein
MILFCAGLGTPEHDGTATGPGSVALVEAPPLLLHVMPKRAW